MSEARIGKVERVPVDYAYNSLNWDFLKDMARVAAYAAKKYGSAEQYADGVLTGDADPINHIAEHLRQFMSGEPHDRFGTPQDPAREFHLAAIAYNAMMAYFYFKAGVAYRAGHKLFSYLQESQKRLRSLVEMDLGGADGEERKAVRSLRKENPEREKGD